jgi:hypothetical protein
MAARINSRLLDQYKGQTIRLTAKIIKLEGETATVEASDGGQVGLLLLLLLRPPLFTPLILFSISPSSSSPNLVSSNYLIMDRADDRLDFI